MRPSSARRPWYARARALFSSICELKNRRNRRRRTGLSVLALEDRIYPSITPLGEFQPSTYRTNDQTNPAVAADAAGNYVVVWQGAGHGLDTSGSGIYGQRYDAYGQTIGNEFLVNEHVTAYDQTYPGVATTADGSFVVTYTSVDPTYNTTQIYYRRYDSHGTALGDERPVHTALGENQTAASVGIAADGSFVVAYQHYYDATLGWDVSAQRFTAQGVALDPLITIWPGSSQDEFWPSLAVQANGSFALSWTGQDNDQHGVYARQFDAAGNGIRTFQLSALTAHNQEIWWSALAPRPDGGFVATWMEWSEGTSWDVKARIFAADGTPVTPELPASVPTEQFQGYSSVAVDPASGFLVAWMDSGKDGDGWGMYGQQYDANGNKLGSETRLNDGPSGDQMWGRVAADGVGNFVTAWASTSTDGTGLNIGGQRVYAGGGHIGNGVVVDPGHAWDDSYSDGSTSIPATVRLTNYSDSSVPIVVLGASGTATISAVGSGS